MENRVKQVVLLALLVWLISFGNGILAISGDLAKDEVDSESLDLTPNLNAEVEAYTENPRTEEAKNDDDEAVEHLYLDAKPEAAADQYLCLDEKLTATNKVFGDLAKDQTDFENLDLAGNQNPENEVYTEKAENEDEAAKYLSLDKKLKATDEYQPKAADDEKLMTKKKVPPEVGLLLPINILQNIYGRLDICARVNLRATSRWMKAAIENNKWGMGFHFPPVMQSLEVVVSNKSWHLLRHPLTPMKSFQVCQVHEFSLVSENRNHIPIRLPPLRLKTPVLNWNASIEFSGNLPRAVNLRVWRRQIYRAVAGYAEVQVVPYYEEVQYRWIVGSPRFDLVGPTASASEIAKSDEGC